MLHLTTVENDMPMISVDALLRTIAEQNEQIQQLNEQIRVLQHQLEHQHRLKLAMELVELVRQYPDKLHYPIVASTETH